MQFRLAATATKFNWISQSISPQRQFLARSLASGTTAGRTADPALHSVDPDEVSRTDSIIDEKNRHRTPEQESTGKDAEPYVHTKSGPKLESSGVGPLTNPIAQQKRRNSYYSTTKLDGSPRPENESEVDRKKQREEQGRDNREYFKHHKASPLSHIQMADTRKPITRATDGGSENYVKIIDGSTVKLWSPEQVDTVDDSLRRAMEIYRRNAERGDPDSPHGRILRQLRGEYW